MGTGKLFEKFEEKQNIKPDYAETLTKMGIALLNKGKNDEAIEAFEKAIEFKPDYAEARNKKGIALEILRREKESEVDKGITMVEIEGPGKYLP